MRHTFRFLISLLSPLAAVFLTTAATTAHASGEIIDFAEIYPATLEACSKMPAEELTRHGAKWDEYYAGKFPSGRMNRILMQLVHESLKEGFSEFRLQDQTALMYGFTHSSDFLTAVDTCYSGNEQAKNAFIFLVKNRDRTGKFVAAGAHVVTALGGMFAALKLAKIGGYIAGTINTGMTALFGLWMFGIYKERQAALNTCRAQTGATDMEGCLRASLKVFEDYNNRNPTFKFDQSDMRKYVELEIRDLKLERSLTKDPAKIRQIDATIDGQLKILASWQR